MDILRKTVDKQKLWKYNKAKHETTLRVSEKRKGGCTMVGSNKAFVNAKEVSEMLGIGTSKAYMIIRRFNNELEQQ